MKYINAFINTGFTITELVVVIAVLALATTAGTVSVLNYNERAQLEQAASEFKNNLVYAQQQATSGEKDVSCGDVELAGWCVRPDEANERIYHIYGSCGQSPAIPDPNPQPDLFPDPPESFEFPNSISLRGYNCAGSTCSFSGGTGAVLFEALGDGVFLAGESEFSRDSGGTLTSVIYCLSSSAPSVGVTNIYNIEILESGEIIDHGIQSRCLGE